MKKTILAILIVVSSGFMYGQNTFRMNEGGRQTYYNINSKGAGRELTYDEITGSPYLTKDFKIAKVADDYEKVPVRYNSYKDEVEFQKDGTTMVLANEPKFSRIEILSPKQTLVWADTGDDLKGYFIELAGGKNALYKKIKTKFNDLVPAANSYSQEKPASFSNVEPVYYIKTEKGFIKKPKSVKDVTEQFSDKKDAIETFVKSNKIKFGKEEDLIKLVNFLNQ